jgi:hypothetical protein
LCALDPHLLYREQRGLVDEKGTGNKHNKGDNRYGDATGQLALAPSRKPLVLPMLTHRYSRRAPPAMSAAACVPANAAAE